MIRRSPRSAPFIVHNDKLKAYGGPVPEVWKDNTIIPVERPVQREADTARHLDEPIVTPQGGSHDSNLDNPDLINRPRRPNRQRPARFRQ